MGQMRHMGHMPFEQEEWECPISLMCLICLMCPINRNQEFQRVVNI
jgi:hypothetical protein